MDVPGLQRMASEYQVLTACSAWIALPFATREDLPFTRLGRVPVVRTNGGGRKILSWQPLAGEMQIAWHVLLPAEVVPARISRRAVAGEKGTYFSERFPKCICPLFGVNPKSETAS